MSFRQTVHHTNYTFDSLKELMAKASPFRTGDALAGIAADTNQERVAAQYALADLPLSHFLTEHLVSYKEDEVTRWIVDSHENAAFQRVAHLTAGGFRDWLLTEEADTASLKALAKGLMPEMVAAVSKLMRNQDLIFVASKCENVTAFRNTLGLKGRFSTRLQPNHPTDDPAGIAAVILDGLLLGSGDAVIGINPATDNVKAVRTLVEMLDQVIHRYGIPTQSCVLSHVTTTMEIMKTGAPVDLVFQSIGGTEATNKSFGVSMSLLDEAYQMALELKRGTVGENVMYFETGQGSSLSANAHHGIDQQTCEARAYAIARKYEPLLVNTVVGFIGPEYLYDGKQITRAGLEDHFCGKLLGLPMGADVCYTNHAEADQDDMDNLLTLLATAGCTYVMGVPGADDIMLNYQSTSFHDALYVRKLLGLRPAPEFEKWWQEGGSDFERFVATSYAFGFVAGNKKDLRAYTFARIHLGKVGVGIPMKEVLAFRAAHAAARDAIFTPFDFVRLKDQLREMGMESIEVSSNAKDYATYLQRPDLGRSLSSQSVTLLQESKLTEADVVIIVSGGLSAAAVNQHAFPLLQLLLEKLRDSDLRVAPVVLLDKGRVAASDPIGHYLQAKLSLILIGERPGLSSPDSMGAYMTYRPKIGLTDESRNCVSNIRPEGLDIPFAAEKLFYLISQSLKKGISGVGLKDEMGLIE